MPDFLIGVTDNPAGAGIKDVRNRERTDLAGSPVEQYVVIQDKFVEAAGFFATTFRVPARAATSQFLATIFNTHASKLCAVRAILVDFETIVAKTVINPYVRAYRITAAPTGGTAANKINIDTADTLDAAISVLGDASADGTASASALTATVSSGQHLSSRFVTRLHTAVGVSVSSGDPVNLLRDIPEKKPIILRQNQGLAVRLEAAAALVANDWHFNVTILAEEGSIV